MIKPQQLPHLGNNRVRCAWVLPLCGLAGCTTSVTITPLSSAGPATCQIHGTVSYNGNPEYLPGVLVRDSSSASSLVFRYGYEAQYGVHPLPVGVQLVNPLNLVGFPTGSDNLVISARLEVVRGDSIVRSYGAAAAMQRSDTIFSEGETFTEMRHRGLLLVRDNIATQICRDQDTLARLDTLPAKVGSGGNN